MTTPEELFSQSITVNRELKETVEDKVGEYDKKIIELEDFSKNQLAQQQGQVDGLSDNISQQFQELSSEVKRLATSATALAPNQIVGTKKWSYFCNGKQNTRMKLGEVGAIISPWACSISGVNANVYFEVVNVNSHTRLEELGIGDLTPLQNHKMLHVKKGDTYYGSEYNILHVEIDVTQVNSSSSYILLSTDCGRYVGWHMGNHRSSSSTFAAVTAMPEDSYLQVHNNRNATSPATEPFRSDDVGKGWQHRGGVRAGIGGCGQWIRVSPNNVGKIKFALALPYFGSGDHGGKPIWSGYLGQETTNTFADNVIEHKGLDPA